MQRYLRASDGGFICSFCVRLICLVHLALDFEVLRQSVFLDLLWCSYEELFLAIAHSEQLSQSLRKN